MAAFKAGWCGPGAGVGASTDEIFRRMAEAERARAAALQDYSVLRHYVLRTAKDNYAEMDVRMIYTHPGKKSFQVISENGSTSVRKRVFRRIIEAEAEASSDGVRDQTRIAPENYEFRLAGMEMLRGRACYVFHITPRVKNRFLLRGKVWVDAQDFAVSRLEGEPAATGSFWIRRMHVVQDYRKIGPFWLADSNRTRTDVRLFGPAELRIEYSEYLINGELASLRKLY